MDQHQPETRTITLEDILRDWGKLLIEVVTGHARIVVEKDGVPMAALVSARDFQR